MGAVLVGVDTIKVMGSPLWGYQLKQSIGAISTDAVARSMASSVGDGASNL